MSGKFEEHTSFKTSYVCGISTGSIRRGRRVENIRCNVLLKKEDCDCFSGIGVILLFLSENTPPFLFSIILFSIILIFFFFLLLN